MANSTVRAKDDLVMSEHPHPGNPLEPGEPQPRRPTLGRRFASGISRIGQSTANAVRGAGEVYGVGQAAPAVKPPNPESNDPNDPRNWNPKHKYLTYLTICLFSLMANVNASNFTVAVVPLTAAFKITTTQATALTALNVLMFGLGNLLWVPLMRVIGKRPVYLLALMLMILTNVWSYFAGSFGSLLAARMCSGIGASAADATVPSVVADLWREHERARKLMYFNICLGSGIFLGPIINAWVVQLHGWRWSPGWMSIVFGFIFVLAFFLIHETEYRPERTHYSPETVPAKRLFLGYLSPTIGLERKKPAQRFITTLKDILLMTLYPQVLYSALLVGIFVGWTIIIQVTLGQNFSNPKGNYKWPLGITGLLHFAGWIGALCSIFAGGWLIDRMYNQARHRLNREGNEEHLAEYRLPGLLLPFIIAPPGLIVWGFCLANHTHWIGYAVGYVLHSFGFVAVSNIVATYLLDNFTKYAGESLVSFFIIRNAIAVLCSFEVQNWLNGVGAKAMFGTMAGLQWAVLGFGVVMFFLANRMQRFTEKFGPQRRLAEEKARNAGLVQARGQDVNGEMELQRLSGTRPGSRESGDNIV